MRAAISFIKLFCFLCLSIITIPIIGLNTIIFSKSQKFFIVPRLYYFLVCKIYGIKIEINGTPEKNNHVVFVSNHISYIDIPVVGSILPATFIAKSEVRTWPILGILASLAQTVFIKRTRDAATETIHDIQLALNKNRSLILFPEGTSAQGFNVLPFKSTIFNLFLHEDLKDKLLIQPFTICLQKINGKSVSSTQDQDIYAWYGDMTMMPHLWTLGKYKNIYISLDFHPSLHIKSYDNRKELANACHFIVQQGLKNRLPLALDLPTKAS